MKTFVVKTLEVIAVVGFVIVVTGAALTGYQRAAWAYEFGYGFAGMPLLGLVMGAVVGFVIAVLIFGLIFLLMDIADNTRRTREVIEAEAARRAPTPAE